MHHLCLGFCSTHERTHTQSCMHACVHSYMHSCVHACFQQSSPAWAVEKHRLHKSKRRASAQGPEDTPEPRIPGAVLGHLLPQFAAAAVLRWSVGLSRHRTASMRHSTVHACMFPCMHTHKFMHKCTNEGACMKTAGWAPGKMAENTCMHAGTCVHTGMHDRTHARAQSGKARSVHAGTHACMTACTSSGLSARTSRESQFGQAVSWSDGQTPSGGEGRMGLLQKAVYTPGAWARCGTTVCKRVPAGSGQHRNLAHR